MCYRQGLAELVQRHKTDSGGILSGSGRRGKQQLLIGTALSTNFGGILWNEISDRARDTAVTDAIEKVQHDMDTLSNYTAVFVEKIKTRFNKECLIQMAITELGLGIAGYDAAIWRLVIGHCPTPPLLTANGCRHIWTRWMQELPHAFPFGDKVLSELPASYCLDRTLFLPLPLALLAQAYHLYNLQDFPVSGPQGKPIYLRSADASTLASPRTRGRTHSWTRMRFGGVGLTYLCVLLYARRDFVTSCVAAL